MGLKSILSNTATLNFTVTDSTTEVGKRSVVMEFSQIAPKDLFMCADSLISKLADEIGVEYRDVLAFILSNKKEYQ